MDKLPWLGVNVQRKEDERTVGGDPDPDDAEIAAAGRPVPA